METEKLPARQRDLAVSSSRCLQAELFPAALQPRALATAFLRKAGWRVLLLGGLP